MDQKPPESTSELPSEPTSEEEYLPLPHPMYIVYGTPGRPYDMKFSATTDLTLFYRLKNAIFWAIFWQLKKCRNRG